jgi:hypothetical protein
MRFGAAGDRRVPGPGAPALSAPAPPAAGV